MRLEVGDIVLGRPNGRPAKSLKDRAMKLMSRLVVKFEALFGDPAEFSHVGIVSKDGETLASGAAQPYVTEALARVETEPWSKNWAGRSFAIYRYRGMTVEARRTVAQLAADYTGRKYGWWKLLVIAADAWVSHKRGEDTRWFSSKLFRDQEPICSYLVQKFTYVAWGETFGVPLGSAQPDDIGDHVESLSYGGGQPSYALVWDTKAED